MLSHNQANIAVLAIFVGGPALWWLSWTIRDRRRDRQRRWEAAIRADERALMRERKRARKAGMTLDEYREQQGRTDALRELQRIMQRHD